MNETAMINRATAALQHLGLKVFALKPPRGADTQHADGWLRIGKGKQRIDYLVETKRALTPATLGAVVAQLRNLAAAGGRPTLLMTDYLTPRLLKSCANTNSSLPMPRVMPTWTARGY